MYKLYLFPIKISGAITDFSVYVYRLLNRENIYWYGTEMQMGCDCTAVVSFFFFLSASPLGPHVMFHTHIQFWTVETSSFFFFFTINTVLQYL